MAYFRPFVQLLLSLLKQKYQQQKQVKRKHFLPYTKQNYITKVTTKQIIN